MQNEKHIWQFARIGGVYRVILESGADLVHLDSLDQKLWTALACPVNGLEMDAKTLQLFDKDNDGKLRVLDVLESVKWILGLIKNPDDLVKRPQTLPLAAINDNTALGKTLLASAKQTLKNLGKPDATEISITDTSDNSAIFTNTIFNGDGVIAEEATDDENLKQWMRYIISSVGSVSDRSGKTGISINEINTFESLCAGYAAWHQKGETNKAQILPFGDKTEAAYALYLSLKSKVDDYFLRCRLAEFDPESAETLNTLSARIGAITNKDISSCMAEIEGFPIAKIEANKPLSFSAPVNPAWKDRLIQFKTALGMSDAMSESDWQALSSKFADYQTWKSEKAGTAVESLGIDTINAFLASDCKAQLQTLIDKDLAVTEEVSNILLVDKLVRFYCQIYQLLNNFVTFSDFYSPHVKSTFQAGTLYFDQRSCDLCIKVTDMAKHGTMASASGICLVYLDCSSKVKNEKMTIVAAFTSGDTDDLIVGRNALFYDNDGNDWDATIVKIVDNPISIRQAFWSPYRKMAKLISKQVEKIAASQEDKVSAATTSGIEKVSTKADEGLNQAVKPTETAPPAAPAPDAKAPEAAATEKPKTTPFDIAKFAGVFAAIGLAIGAIGSVIMAVISGFLSLEWWKMPLAILGLILIISGPSMVLAWLKLRKRNLAPVLDANGWAVNAKAIISIPFGTRLTHLAKMPKNAQMNMNVPFNEKKSSMPLVLAILAVLLIAGVVVLWYLGYLHEWGILDNTGK